MCRHLGYLGPAVAVSEPVLRGEHSLYRQSWAPRDMRAGGTINADGFGVAWWRTDGSVSNYRNPMPIWTDPAVGDVLSQIEATAVVAAVRSATVGMPVDRGACAPFTAGRWAFSHNGVVPNWRTTLGQLATSLSPAHLLELEAPTDSAALWLQLRARLTQERRGSDWVAGELAEFAGSVVAAAPDARLNILLSDGETLWATTYYHSLSLLSDDASVVLSSEPYDRDPNWQPVGDRRIVTAVPGHVCIEAF
ncbi:ergothioneine biosynthesis protein EgtC [Skermania sp. ID1734]|uniref:ergothioneine biosynthesis protein EgtC n=1 Tax=Skermania sp. ID1734 TaxID=2597516 RepID=UPI00117EC7A5|nr:ergothioneine biosynthesis protein EgtC [Skermania sp. ID1734]TSD99769.1 ergothioneine biosynthesis protein EgtC [Skermania sp. ID1734]